ncbi:hypothetical protein HY969_04050 [Candidatus Kaiserbacteria bacterium]|nr:hypothetical protein [Candidatus Kaiserbacteria bacterium]
MIEYQRKSRFHEKSITHHLRVERKRREVLYITSMRSNRMFLPAVALGCAAFFAAWILSPELLLIASALENPAVAEAAL